MSHSKQAHRGIQGVVTTTAGTPLEGATISISGLHRNHVLTSQHGDFWLLLPDGQYSITVSAEGHSSETLPAVVSGREVMVLKFTLPEESTIMGFPIYLFLGMLGKCENSSYLCDPFPVVISYFSVILIISSPRSHFKNA